MKWKLAVLTGIALVLTGTLIMVATRKQKNFLGRSDLSRGLQNNNPGNVRLSSDRWMGQVTENEQTDTDFVQFIDLPFGIRAMMTVIMNYVITAGVTTLYTLVEKYDYPGRDRYYTFLMNQGNKRLPRTEDEFKKLIADMIIMENGIDGRQNIDQVDLSQGYALVRWNVVKDYFSKVQTI
jgi:hypothetical protein